MIEMKLVRPPARHDGGGLAPWLRERSVGESVWVESTDPDFEGEVQVFEIDVFASGRNAYVLANCLGPVPPAKVEIVEETVERVITETTKTVVLRLTEDEARDVFNLIRGYGHVDYDHVGPITDALHAVLS